MQNYQSPVLLNGMGGMGKSKLMNYWVREVHSRKISNISFQHIIHIDCSVDVETGFLNNYDLIDQLEINHLLKDITFNKLDIIIASLNRLDELLLVLDDLPWQEKFLDKCADQLARLSTLPCHMIATSRSKDYEDFRQIHINSLSTKQCIDLYLTHSKTTTVQADEHIEKVQEIVELAGNHTLTIELLGKTAHRQQYSPNELLNLLREKQFHIDTKVRYKKGSTSANESIYTALGKLFSLSGLNKQQQEVLYHLSLIDSQEISFDLLIEWLGEDLIKDKSMLMDLLTSGWLQIGNSSNNFDSQYYQLHQVVSHAVLTEFCNAYLGETRTKFLQPVVTQLEKYYKQFDTYENNQKVVNQRQRLNEACLPAVASYLSYSVCLINQPNFLERFVHKLNEFAIFCQQQGFYKLADSILVTCRDHVLVHLGESNPYYVTTLNNIVSIKLSIQDFKTALPLLEQVRLIVNSQIDGSYKVYDIYASTLNNLAYCNMNLGRMAQAEDLYEKTLNIRKTYRKDHEIDYASILNNLGSFYVKNERHAKAIPILIEAKSLIAKRYNEQHPYYADIISVLGNAYLGKQKYKEAIILFHQALDIREKKLGANRLEYASSLHNLAIGYGAIKNFEKALLLCIEAINIAENILDENTPIIQTMKNDCRYIQYFLKINAK
ncbi:MAG: tetratricopeptide repeat protein [Psychrobacter alimentarius]